MMQGGMELRVLHAAAHKVTWYGQWGYQYGRGAFNITQNKCALTLTLPPTQPDAPHAQPIIYSVAAVQMMICCDWSIYT